jgi:hypothetical protein
MSTKQSAAARPLKNRGVFPRNAEECPFAKECRARRCRATKCRRIAQRRDAIESAYRELPHYHPAYEPVIQELAQAKLIIACLDHQINEKGMTQADEGDRLVATRLLRERRQWVTLVAKMHGELCPRHTAEQAADEPMGLFEAMSRVLDEEASARPEPPGDDDEEPSGAPTPHEREPVSE